MDIDLFYEDNFETKLWINNILKENGTQENKEMYTASVVKKLQLYVQQVNASLEEASQQVLFSLPRILRDAKSLQNEALLLKEQMGVVKEEIIKVERNTGHSMAMIERLDRIKTNLQQAKQGLHEADNWTLLANDLEEDFQSSNIENICKKLISMQQSLKILVNVSDYEDRKLQLEELKNRLEAMTSPSIVQAFTSGNIEQSNMYVKMFVSIGRLPQVEKYYHKCQRGILLQKWRNQLDIEQDESVVQWMHNFYSLLLSNWHTQFKWFNSVFGQYSSCATNTLIEIYIDLLMNLEPTFNCCIDAALKQQHTDHKLVLLLELKEITKQFANNLFVVIKEQQQSEQLLLLLAQAIYNPYIQYVANYGAYEQAYLIQQLSLHCSVHIDDDISESVQILNLTTPYVLDQLREAKKRCEELTENCGLHQLLIALQAYLLNYIDQYRIVLRRIDRNQSSKEEQEDNDEDWNMFQICLTLLQNVGQLLMNLQMFEKQLFTDSINITTTKGTRNDYMNYKLLLLTTSGQKEYDLFIRNIMKEGRELFDVSIYNALHKLCADIHHTTHQVIAAPICAHLQSVKALETDSAVILPTLPDYSFAPQEYITQIGQYLMVLPQHLEPFLLDDNPALNSALKATHLQEYTVLNHTEEEEDEERGRLTDVFLSIIARDTCRFYCDQILSIRELKPSACRQLANDIDYLCNVLDDLGLCLTDSLQQILILLRLTPEQYSQQTSGCSARLVAAVRQMRNLTSSSSSSVN